MIYSIKDFYLLDTFNKKIELLKAAGFIEYWNSQYIDLKLLSFKDPQYPKVLTILHMMGGFQILGFGYCMGLLVFLIELLHSIIKTINEG